MYGTLTEDRRKEADVCNNQRPAAKSNCRDIGDKRLEEHSSDSAHLLLLLDKDLKVLVDDSDSEKDSSSRSNGSCNIKPLWTPDYLTKCPSIRVSQRLLDPAIAFPWQQRKVKRTHEISSDRESSNAETSECSGGRDVSERITYRNCYV